ncbi:MAG: OmpA family protein [Cellvibrionaceae bacterium]
MIKKIGVISAFVFAASGCTSIDPYTGEQKTSNTAKGAGIGAIVGAIAGAASESGKDRRKAALRGAAIGAAGGAGIGYYMDQQEAKLRQVLEGTGVRVRRDGNTINLVMPGNITFATNRYEIRSNFYSVLNSVGLILEEFDKTTIRVSGHTDSRGSDAYNLTLSQKRADSVSMYLKGRKVEANRINAKGYGESYPIASNETASGRQENRRVELDLEPMAASQ